MAGTKSGGLKARDKNLARDPDWYKKIGQAGGAKSRTSGFGHGGADPHVAGRKGGIAGNRAGIKQPTQEVLRQRQKLLRLSEAYRMGKVTTMDFISRRDALRG